jgi:hypothetical protein
MDKRAPLSQLELAQRKAAGEASGRARQQHHAETTPSVRQGSTAAPSRRAVALFRQGQARPDTRAKRGAWDTRSVEPPVGAMNASFTFHLPKSYLDKTPDRPRLGPKSLAMALARAKAAGSPHQDVVVTNPAVLAEAHRHKQMREIITRTVGVVRDHQAGTIEQGHKRGLIPEGTRPGTVARAYKHAALKAMHKAGLGAYDHQMDDEAKREFAPLVPFMRYAHRRVFDHLNQGALKGKWTPFREEYGVLFRQKYHGKYTGKTRMRMKPNDEFIKVEFGDLGDAALAKAWLSEIPPIAGSTERLPSGLFRVVDRSIAFPTPLAKSGGVGAIQRRAAFSMPLAKSDGFFLGDFNTDPKRQLARAMRPRLRQRRVRLRLNTQKHLRRLLSGGITRQERWQLGATTRMGKLEKGALGAIAGAAVAGGAAKLIHHALAARRVRANARNLYSMTLKNAVREHLRHVEGGVPSPHINAGARRAFHAAKKLALHQAKTQRNEGLRRLKTPKSLLLGAGAAGGALGGTLGGRRPSLPPLYQSAALQDEETRA